MVWIKGDTPVRKRKHPFDNQHLLFYIEINMIKKHSLYLYGSFVHNYSREN
jgi:hypothetical protein